MLSRDVSRARRLDRVRSGCRLVEHLLLLRLLVYVQTLPLSRPVLTLLLLQLYRFGEDSAGVLLRLLTMAVEGNIHRVDVAVQQFHFRSLRLCRDFLVAGLVTRCVYVWSRVIM